MKRTLFAILTLALCVFVAAKDTKTPQEEYISKYAGIAVAEMYRSGIPASITLAQGLLESGAGRSSLASEGNNHFGIKCHNNWKGKTMRADDDAKNECFRAYSSAEESFRDHSDFLRYRDRYKFLFDFDITDYKSWAAGLKKAGYATDPAYASKLIKYIEDYGLSVYDNMTVQEVYSAVPEAEELSSEEEYPSEIPDSPLNIEAASSSYAGGIEQYSFAMSRKLYSRNGVPFVQSVEGETYSSIAKENNLFLREILRYNDLKSDRQLLPGTVVYLAAKKKMAAKGLDKYIVESDGESLRDIAQRFAIKKKNLLKMNDMTESSKIYEGDEIYLRPAIPSKVELRKR
ncbi:MAG: glucosaminidase domain-containing protein [Bacteroidales bacterium]|jgi:LysM repeat protein|nr:glucosaminidase domain-containing protein [Bacteroidales bacterium]MBQ3845953.1 glucosaminidase domain-containing protein [Bacteroidales bacterium]